MYWKGSAVLGAHQTWPQPVGPHGQGGQISSQTSLLSEPTEEDSSTLFTGAPSIVSWPTASQCSKGEAQPRSSRYYAVFPGGLWNTSLAGSSQSNRTPTAHAALGKLAGLSRNPTTQHVNILVCCRLVVNTAASSTRRLKVCLFERHHVSLQSVILRLNVTIKLK